MRTRENTNLGIDLHDSEIRIVKVRTIGKTVQVVQAAATPTPAGAVVQGQIREPAAVGIALRRMFESMGISDASRAAFGVGGPSTTVRTLSLPPTPPEELAALVSNEVEYHQVVHDGGAYGFLAVSRDSADELQVIVAGSEAFASEPVGTIAATSNLTISGVEPVPFAAYRGVAISRPAGVGVLLLAPREASCDLLYARGNELGFLRRIEIGSLHLQDELDLVRRVPSLAADSFNRSGARGYSETPKLDQLVTEVQRSIEYLAREFPEFSALDRMTLLPDQPFMVDLGRALESRLDIPVELPSIHEIEAKFPDSYRFAVAYGLALVGTPWADRGLPPIDLYTQTRAKSALRENLRNLAGSLGVSVAALMLGAVGFSLYGRQIADVRSEAQRLNERASSIQGEALVALDEQHKEERRYRLLASQGIPLGPLTGEISQTLTSGVGLSGLTISADQRVVIIGEAKSESEMISTLEGMKRSPLLRDMAILSFDRKDPQGIGGLSFQFAGNTIPLSQIKKPASAVQQVSMR